jgi:hypothetical protein
MDERLERAWKVGDYPFNQTLVETEDLIPIGTLLKCLQDLIAFLKNQIKSDAIFLNHDWHEHDGTITPSKITNWINYEMNLKDIQALYDSADGDDYVRITIYPNNLEFVLRYYILDQGYKRESNPNRCGKFDLIIDNRYLESIINILKDKRIKYNLMLPKLYFDKSYLG